MQKMKIDEMLRFYQGLNWTTFVWKSNTTDDTTHQNVHAVVGTIPKKEKQLDTR